MDTPAIYSISENEECQDGRQRQRRKLSAEFKAEIALQALSGEKNIAELCREHGITGQQVGQWKQVVVQQAAQLFGGNSGPDEQVGRVSELERMVGKLTMQLDIAKKASTPCTDSTIIRFACWATR